MRHGVYGRSNYADLHLKRDMERLVSDVHRGGLRCILDDLFQHDDHRHGNNLWEYADGNVRHWMY